MKDNPIKQLGALDQSVWLDYISRELLSSGTLKTMMERDGLMGMTSNPTIFEKAMVDSSDYDFEIRALAQQKKDALAIYEALSQADVQRAADEFRPVYEKTNGKDGYVSLEVNPHLAYDTEGTIEEARRFVTSLNRPNIMIKVPATREGLRAIEVLTRDGVNINATLIFGLPRYREVALAYITGLEKRVADGKTVERIHSVASFFISRIDTSVDAALEKVAAQGGAKADQARSLLGTVAIAGAKAAYRIYDEMFGGVRFAALRKKGANAQRLLWASTSTKNPKYSDVKYVEALIGAHTVNTIPNETLDLYRDHGNPKARLTEGIDEAVILLGKLGQIGVNLDEITQFLETDGVEKFNKSFDGLIAALQAKVVKGV